MKQKKSLVWFLSAMVICAMALFGLAGCGSAEEEAAPEETTTVEETTVEETTVQETTTAAATEEIGEDKALELALAEAGFSANDVERTNVHLDIDDGVKEYEVQFYKDGMEYEYNVDAYTGEVYDRDVDSEYDD